MARHRKTETTVSKSKHFEKNTNRSRQLTHRKVTEASLLKADKENE